MAGTTGTGAGLMIAQFGLLHTAGYAAGQLGDSMAAGDESGALLLQNPQSAGLNIPDPTTLNIQGGDTTYTTFSFGNVHAQPFQLTSALLQPDAVALATGGAVDVTSNSKFQMFSANPDSNQEKVGFLILTQRYQPVSTGSDGPDKYFHLIIPRCGFRWKYSGMQSAGESTGTLFVSPRRTKRLVNGLLVSASAMAVTNNTLTWYGLITDYPIHLYSYRSDGSTTTGAFTTPYKPATTTVTSGAAENWLTINGVTTALASINASTGACALSAAGTAGDWHVLMYQTEDYDLVS